MNHQQSKFDRIILGDLRPWLELNRHEEKFASEIGDIKLVEPRFQPIYEIDFHLRFNSKTRYYHKLITNEVNNYCNHLIELISEENDPRVIKYLLRNRFKSKVKTQLKDVAKIIKANDYDLKYIDPQKSDFSVDKDHKSDTYVMLLLKTALIKVYREVQEKFKSYIPEDDYMEISDLLALADSYNEPSFLMYHPIVDIALTEVTPQEEVLQKSTIDSADNVQKEIYFIALQTDFRGISRSPIHFEDIRDANKFSDFEADLADSKIIDGNYHFIIHKGNKKLLAALYHILIQKNFFRKNSFRHQKDFEPYHIRQYLDFRYDADTTQEFKKCTERDIEKFKSKYLWIDNIPFCR